MLVLSRRADEKIVFPGLGISLTVLRVKGSVVKVGIDAPKQVKVLRDEVSPEAVTAEKDAPLLQQLLDSASRDVRHELLNRLNTVSIGLHLLRKQSEAGLHSDAESVLTRVLRDLHGLEAVVGGPPATAAEPVKRRALLVEDDRNERELLAGYLRLSGFEVDGAEDGVDALEHLAQDTTPDLILLDMQMPRCNGAQTIHMIRRNPTWQDLRVYAISGSQPDELGVQVGQGGVDHWFAKPLNPELLVREIREAFPRGTNPSLSPAV
jgi:carbon storage regulator CsrA